MKKIMFNDKYGLTQAVLEGRKTQTRRILLPHTVHKLRNGNDYQEVIRLYSTYKVGEVVAVAQRYKDIALDLPVELAAELIKQPGWTNKMFVKADLMPNRIRITNIRIERLQDISEEDCLAEGIVDFESGINKAHFYSITDESATYGTAKKPYSLLIDKIAGKGTWKNNPYVFVYDFELIK